MATLLRSVNRQVNIPERNPTSGKGWASRIGMLLPWKSRQLWPYGGQSPIQRAKVIEGSDGWLFLSNDTNNSIDQHQGKLRLTSRGLRAWRKYADQLARISSQHHARAIFLAAPTKESVLGQFHPLPSGGPSPVQQLESLLGDELLLHPTKTLHELGTKAYSRTDTHWSDRAAGAVVVELAKRLNVPEANWSLLFQQDVYVQEQTCGDLGNKLQPPRVESIDVLDPQLYSKFIVYDNGLRNTGRIMASENHKAAHQATLLLLGTSSSYAIFKFACRVFSRVVLAHTAAGLDLTLISSVKPAYVVACANARFVIQVPSLKYNLLHTIRSKLRQMSLEERQVTFSNRIAASPETLHRLGIAAYDI